MIGAGESNKHSLFCNPVSWSSIIVARINRMSVVETFADGISLHDLIAHDDSRSLVELGDGKIDDGDSK